jgi:hypothetical protein
MAIIRGILALLAIAYGLFNTIAPISTALYKLQGKWPMGWTLAQKVLVLPPFNMGAAGADRYQRLMDVTNWLQVAMWLLADILYIVAGLRLVGMRPRGAFAVFAVALLLDLATWFTFKRLAVYDQTFSPMEQRQDYMIFAAVAVLGALVWLTGRSARRPRIQPTLLTE